MHAYDQNGNFLMKISMLCVENVEMETALSSKNYDFLKGCLCQFIGESTNFYDNLDYFYGR